MQGSEEATNSLKENEKKQFLQSRRSLKIFPIDGEGDSELVVNLVAFLVQVLCIPKSVANGGAVEKIRRLGATRFF